MRFNTVARAIDPDQQEDIGLFLHNGNRQENVWNIGNTFDHHLASLCLFGHLKQLQPEKEIKGSVTLRIKFHIM